MNRTYFLQKPWGRGVLSRTSPQAYGPYFVFVHQCILTAILKWSIVYFVYFVFFFNYVSIYGNKLFSRYIGSADVNTSFCSFDDNHDVLCSLV